MKMQPLDKDRYGQWDLFVSRAKGTIFHTAWWYDAWGVDFDIYARCGQDGEIEAGMPVYIGPYRHMPRIFGIKGVDRPPLTLVNGPLFLESRKTCKCDRYAHAKNEALCAISSLPTADYYDILLHSFQEDLMPYIWNGFDTQVYYTYVIPRGEAETWRSNIRGSARENLRKAHKEAETNGYWIEADPPLNETLPLFFRTAEANGYSEDLDNIAGMMPVWWEAVTKKGAGRSYLLRDGAGKALCAAMMVWDDYTAYSIISGMDPSARKLGNVSMLLWERRIQDALSMGLDFDFEGSSLLGVEGFIRRWGGELRPCFRVTKVPSLLTYMGIKAYRYLKFHRDCDWVGCETGRGSRKPAEGRRVDTHAHSGHNGLRSAKNDTGRVHGQKNTQTGRRVKDRIAT